MYALSHYKHGVPAVFSKTTEEGAKQIVACIEDHQFQPKNYWYSSSSTNFASIKSTGTGITGRVLIVPVKEITGEKMLGGGCHVFVVVVFSFGVHEILLNKGASVTDPHTLK